jgi:ParB-like chromosome segregation protein Spo0J
MMEHRKANPDQINVPEVRVTARFDEETWRQFQSSMTEVGAIAPVICCEVDGQLVLVDGLHRLMEALRLKRPEIDVVVIPGDMIDVLTKNIFLDHLRGKTPVSEMVKVIETLSKEYELGPDQIAEKTGMTRDYVEKLLKVSELTPYCREALDQERIKIGHAVELARIKDPVRQETVLGQLELYHWPVKELHEYIDQLEAILAQPSSPPGGSAPPPPLKSKCFYCREDYDPSELAFPPTCRECSSMMIQAIAQARREFAQEQTAQKAADQATK